MNENEINDQISRLTEVVSDLKSIISENENLQNNEDKYNDSQNLIYGLCKYENTSTDELTEQVNKGLFKNTKLIPLLYSYANENKYIDFDTKIGEAELADDTEEYKDKVIELFSSMLTYKNFIVGNSTFSFWGALVGSNTDSKIVISKKFAQMLNLDSSYQFSNLIEID